MNPTSSTRRSAFTLVELLVVIAIITLLAAIITPAVYYATVRAKNARTALEIAAIEKALEAYKLEMGEYPPDFSELSIYTPAQVTERATLASTIISDHLQRTFRRRSPRDLPRVPGGTAYSEAFLANLSPENALVFWLSGFTQDPQLPLFGSGPRSPFFEFDKGRVRVAEFSDGSQLQATTISTLGAGDASSDTTSGFADLTMASGYFSKGSPEPGGLPYVYYRSNPVPGVVIGGVALPREATAYLGPMQWANFNRPVWSAFTSSVPAPNPMVSTNVPVPGFAGSFGFAAPNKFHLYAAGQDNSFATANPSMSLIFDMNGVIQTAQLQQNLGLLPIFPKGASYTPGHEDNITNFTGGATLEDSKPE